MSKLTLVSLTYRGKTFSRLVQASPSKDGKIRVDPCQVFPDLFKYEIYPNTTYSIG